MYVLSGLFVDGTRCPDLHKLNLTDLFYEYDEISCCEAQRLRDSKKDFNDFNDFNDSSSCGSYCSSSSSDDLSRRLWPEFDAVTHVETGVDVTAEFKKMWYYENRDGAIADAEAKILDSVDGAGRVAERRRLADLATLRERARVEREQAEAEERRVFELEAKARKMRRESATLIATIERERELALLETRQARFFT